MIFPMRVPGESTPGLLLEARGSLRETFGFDSFREGQERVIEAIFSGRDVLVIMPTGSGKSLCYQIPALVLPGVTVVVSPLIALMKDQVDALSLRGARVTFINSSISAEEQWSRLQELQRGAYKLVYVAPERFRSGAFRSALAQVEVSLLAVDEAHCISQWGHDFRPDYRKLKTIRSQLGEVPAIALTATATPDVREDILRELGMQDAERVITGFDRPNLGFEVQKVRGRSFKETALHEFILQVARDSDDGAPPPGIIYTGTRKRAEEVAQFLNTCGYSSASSSRSTPACRAYHAGLEAPDRRSVQEDFMEGRLSWVAATNAFGMGVDKSDIRFVVHYDLPGSIEAYYQEVGRGGRDGNPARCLLLFAEGDRRLQEFFIDGSNPDRQTIEAVYRFLCGLGENPIFRTLVELESLFQACGASPSGNPLVFRSSVALLERAGVLDRLDHYENLAEVTAVSTPWEPNPYPQRAPVKRNIYQALGRVFARSEGEPVNISLERWAVELSLTEDSLRRGLAQLEVDGVIRYLPPFRGRAIRLPPAPPPLETSGIDFPGLRQRRDRDFERLEAVLRFARSRSCRRDLILSYFGEPVPENGCGRCDRCKGKRGGAARARDLEEGEKTVVRKILSGVARTRGRCGRGRVIDMLRGSRSQGIVETGLNQLSTYGLLREYSREEIQEILDLLEAAGCTRRSGDRYPLVVLTDSGVKVMKGEEEIALALSRPLASPAGGSPGARRKQRLTPTTELTDEEDLEFNRELFEELRGLRREIADELSVPAYRIFNDRTLRGMARDIPVTEHALLQVPGVGGVTLERFGERFLGVLRLHNPSTHGEPEG